MLITPHLRDGPRPHLSDLEDFLKSLRLVDFVEPDTTGMGRLRTEEHKEGARPHCELVPPRTHLEDLYAGVFDANLIHTQ